MHDAFEPDNLLQEGKNRHRKTKRQIIKKLNPERSKLFLLFIISNWIPDNCKIKHTVAIFTTSNGISSQFWVSKINKMIISLNKAGLIINNVITNEATENRSTMRSIDAHTVADFLDKKYFLQKTKKYILIWREKRSGVYTFIEEGMHRIVKKMINILESSCKENIQNKLGI